MNLPHLLHELEIGNKSAAQAEQEIRDEIERVEMQSRDLIWRMAIRELKIALGLLNEIEK